MTNKQLIEALALSELSEADIVDMIHSERTKKSKIVSARNNIIVAFEKYLKIFLPDLSFSTEDRKFFEEQFHELEKGLLKLAPLTLNPKDINKLNDEEINKMLVDFLKDINLV